jgi:Flp pilus assembly protein TadD
VGASGKALVMRRGIAQTLAIAVAGLWLTACGTANKLTGSDNSTDPQAAAANDAGTQPSAGAAPETTGSTAPQTTGTVPPALGVAAASEPGLLGSDPNDDLNRGKIQYRANNFGLAEKHFRHAVELHPNDAEAWLGLAASYDRLRRFDLADRAYKEAIRILGPTVEVLNNQGFSYMLRGDYRHAREKLLAAQRKDPGNKYVANNLHLLDESLRKGKGIE